MAEVLLQRQALDENDRLVVVVGLLVLESVLGMNGKGEHQFVMLFAAAAPPNIALHSLTLKLRGVKVSRSRVSFRL